MTSISARTVASEEHNGFFRIFLSFLSNSVFLRGYGIRGAFDIRPYGGRGGLCVICGIAVSPPFAGGLFVRIKTIIAPIARIVYYVFRDVVVIAVIADDVVVVRTLPNGEPDSFICKSF
jgi:hypothetical protein